MGRSAASPSRHPPGRLPPVKTLFIAAPGAVDGLETYENEMSPCCDKQQWQIINLVQGSRLFALQLVVIKQTPSIHIYMIKSIKNGHHTRLLELEFKNLNL